MATGPAYVIPAPALTPPPTGLIRTATVIEHTDDLHMGGALEWGPEGCGDAVAIDPCVGGPVGLFYDGATTSASTTFTSATAAFTAADVGRMIFGPPGIASGTYIASVSNATTVILSLPATATATLLNFLIAGRPVVNNRPGKIRYDSFAVEAHDVCSTFGFPAGEYEARARRLLAARESKAVEAEWWVGLLFPQNPHLAKVAGTNGTNATTLAGGVAQGLRIALALLTQALADNNGGTGMIHARPFLVELWAGLQLIRVDGGGKIWTYTGNPVVAGTGYPGTGPNGEARAAGSEWAFCSDEVIVHRGPMFVPMAGGVTAENTDYVNNQVRLRAERQYALTTNGCVVAAINVNPTQP